MNLSNIVSAQNTPTTPTCDQDSSPKTSFCTHDCEEDSAPDSKSCSSACDSSDCNQEGGTKSASSSRNFAAPPQNQHNNQVFQAAPAFLC